MNRLLQALPPLLVAVLVGLLLLVPPPILALVWTTAALIAGGIHAYNTYQRWLDRQAVEDGHETRRLPLAEARWQVELARTTMNLCVLLTGLMVLAGERMAAGYFLVPIPFISIISSLLAAQEDRAGRSR